MGKKLTRAVKLGRGLAWLANKLVLAMTMIAWCAYVWFSGRSWRHAPARRWVTRPVRASGNCLLAVVVAAALWHPVATGVALAVLGACLVGTALVIRHRTMPAVRPPAGGPIRVKATVHRPPAREGR